jgi:hypothetical protein
MPFLSIAASNAISALMEHSVLEEESIHAIPPPHRFSSGIVNQKNTDLVIATSAVGSLTAFIPTGNTLKSNKTIGPSCR